LVVEPYLATMLGGRLVTRNGTPPQQQRILPALIQGKLKMAFAQTERGARWDLRHVSTGAADVLVVSARTSGGERDASGISLFLVERGAPGVKVSEYRTLDNLRVADVKLAGVGADALLGREGRGFELADEIMDYATALVCAEAVGAIKYAHDATLEYLKTRRQFGVPIGTFQALQHRMVDILISYEQARSIACLACVKVDATDADERRRAVSAAKIKIADACRHVSKEAVQLHGGMGMTEELKISHTFR